MHIAPYFGRVRLCGQKLVASKNYKLQYNTWLPQEKVVCSSFWPVLRAEDFLAGRCNDYLTFSLSWESFKFKFWSPLHPLAIVVSFDPLTSSRRQHFLSLCQLFFSSLKGNYYSSSSFIHTASWRQCSGSPPCFFINNNLIGSSLCLDVWVWIVFWRDDPAIKQQSLLQSATRNQAATQPSSFGKVSEDLLPLPFQIHTGLPPHMVGNQPMTLAISH